MTPPRRSPSALDRRSLVAGLALAPWLAPPAAAQPDGIRRAPAELRRGLEERLTRFEAWLDQRPAPSPPSRPVFGAELPTGNTHRGPPLLDGRGWAANMNYLNRLQGLGVEGVTVQMAYPMLRAGSPRAEDYWDFYRRLVPEIRRRGLKLLAKSGPIFRQREHSDQRLDYRGLSVADYLSARQAIAQRVARELEPDWLSIGSEPSGEARQLGFDIDPETYLAFVERTLAGIDRRRTKVGAGTGTWDNPAYVEAFATRSRLDFIDLHVFPLGAGPRDFLRVTTEWALAARRRGKEVIVGEFWLYKARAEEMTAGIDAPELFSRDAFSYWAPLDQRMIAAMTRIARHAGIAYISPYWARYLFAYLEPDAATERLSPGDRLRATERAALAALPRGGTSPTGEAYRRLIAQR